jgi:hypothetical protein
VLIVFAINSLLANTPKRLYFGVYIGCWSEQCTLRMDQIYFEDWGRVIFWPNSFSSQLPPGFWRVHDEAFRGCLFMDIIDLSGKLVQAEQFDCGPIDENNPSKILLKYMNSRSDIFEREVPLVINRNDSKFCVKRVPAVGFVDYLFGNYVILDADSCG